MPLIFCLLLALSGCTVTYTGGTFTSTTRTITITITECYAASSIAMPCPPHKSLWERMKEQWFTQQTP